MATITKNLMLHGTREAFRPVNTVAEPNNGQPRMGAGNTRQVGVTYGHDVSGKVYTYLGGDGLRVGDLVTPEVTHHISGKTYKTLARVVTTRDATGNPAQEVSASLAGEGIVMKTIGPTDQRSLPGFQGRGEGFTAKQWEKEAESRLVDRLGGNITKVLR